MSDKRRDEKIECFEEWMKGDHVMIHLDTRNDAASVPPAFKDNPSLSLQLSYAFRGETTHDDDEIRSFLKFHGEYFECVIPWSSIWGINSSEGDSRVWPQDMPKELLVDLARSKLQEVGKKMSEKFLGKDSDQTAEPTQPKPPRKVELQDVTLSKDENEELETKTSDSSSEKTTRRAPQLKRVK